MKRIYYKWNDAERLIGAIRTAFPDATVAITGRRILVHAGDDADVEVLDDIVAGHVPLVPIVDKVNTPNWAEIDRIAAIADAARIAREDVLDAFDAFLSRRSQPVMAASERVAMDALLRRLQET